VPERAPVHHLTEARQIIEEWRIDYNTRRPHTSLNGLTPAESKLFKGSCGLGTEDISSSTRDLYFGIILLLRDGSPLQKGTLTMAAAGIPFCPN
jgi:hypothetical protein